MFPKNSSHTTAVWVVSSPKTPLTIVRPTARQILLPGGGDCASIPSTITTTPYRHLPPPMLYTNSRATAVAVTLAGHKGGLEIELKSISPNGIWKEKGNSPALPSRNTFWIVRPCLQILKHYSKSFGGLDHSKNWKSWKLTYSTREAGALCTEGLHHDFSFIFLTFYGMICCIL